MLIPALSPLFGRLPARTLRVAGAAFWLLVFVGCAARPAAAGTHTITGLGNLGGSESFAHSTNRYEQVVGGATRADTSTRAFIWDRVQGIRELGTLGGTFSEAWEINDFGLVTGTAATAAGQLHAFRWQPGAMTDLGTLGGTFSVGLGINDSNVVVGYSEDSQGAIRPFIHQNDAMTAMPTLGGSFGFATAINDAGLVCGYAETGSATIQACTWQSGTVTALPDLGGGASAAYSVNDTGAIAGIALTPAGQLRAVSWQNGAVTELPGLGGAYTAAFGINETGVIVGEAETAAGEIRPVCWAGGYVYRMDELLVPDSGWSPLTSVAVNYREKVIGTGLVNGQPQAYLIAPAPTEVLDGQDLFDDVQALLNSQSVSTQDARPLEQKVQDAIAAIAGGNEQLATNMLNAFINQTNALMNSGRLDQGLGNQLINTAEDLIADLQA